MSFVALAGGIAGVATSLGAGATAAGIIGGVGAGALGGAGLGALSSAITGGDIGKGAMFGALGGAATGGLGSALGGAGGSAAGASTGGTASAGAPVAAAGTPAAAAPTIATSSTGGIAPGSVINAMGGTGGNLAGAVPASSGVGVTGGAVTAPIAGPVGAGSGMSTTALPASGLYGGAANPYAGTLFGNYAAPIIGIGAMAGNYLGSDTEPTQAGAPPGSGDNFLSYYKFNPRRYRPSQPFYIKPANYAAGGIASLNPNPDMMASGPAKVDFMGSDAYPTSQQKLSFYSTPSQMPTSAQQAAASYEPATNPLTGAPMANFASGGISDLGGYSDGGHMTEGPGDGMSDSIPASIAGKRPARLAQGEFVVPADVVSHLGNGSTDAGAKQLYSMMDRVRKARTGRKAQGKQIKADKMMPA